MTVSRCLMGVCEILSLMSHPALWGVGGGGRLHMWVSTPLGAPRDFGSHHHLLPSAAKAVDGYVKPQIKQVVPE